MGEVGSVYLNFGLWGISLIPAWYLALGTTHTRNMLSHVQRNMRHKLTYIQRWNRLVIKEIGTKYSKSRREHEGIVAASPAESVEREYEQKI